MKTIIEKQTLGICYKIRYCKSRIYLDVKVSNEKGPQFELRMN